MVTFASEEQQRTIVSLPGPAGARLGARTELFVTWKVRDEAGIELWVEDLCDVDVWVGAHRQRGVGDAIKSILHIFWLNRAVGYLLQELELHASFR